VFSKTAERQCAPVRHFGPLLPNKPLKLAAAVFSRAVGRARHGSG
jgi:hypothetical protein